MVSGDEASCGEQQGETAANHAGSSRGDAENWRRHNNMRSRVTSRRRRAPARQQTRTAPTGSRLSVRGTAHLRQRTRLGWLAASLPGSCLCRLPLNRRCMYAFIFTHPAVALCLRGEGAVWTSARLIDCENVRRRDTRATSHRLCSDTAPCMHGTSSVDIEHAQSVNVCAKGQPKS